MKRTTLTLDDHLFGKLQELTGAPTGTGAIRAALEEFVRMQRRPMQPSTLNDLLAFVGSAPEVDEDFARDLEAIRREQPPLPGDPWPS